MYHWWQMDHFLIDFVQGNTITLYIIGTVLKGMAMAHPGVKSNTIYEMFSLVVNSLRKKDAPDFEQLPAANGK